LLHEAPRERRTPSALADAAGVTRGTMTGLLAGLERAGLVTRAVHPDDARMFTIELAAPARDLLERVLPERVARIMAFMAALTPEEQCQLRGLLAKLEGAMSALSSP
jgi:DNA-binding MarR family transcriptional regulator